MTTTRITVERMRLADDARGLARKVRKLVKRAERNDVEISLCLKDAADLLSGMAAELPMGRNIFCHCGAAALETAYWPRSGRATMAATLDALMRGEEMVCHPVCVEHAQNSYVGHPLCPCGERAAHVVTLWPRAARRVSRYDPEVWQEYAERAYLMCADCAMASDCEESRPYHDTRPAPEHGPMLDTLLRRVRCLESMGYGTSAAFHVMSGTVEGGFLMKPSRWLNLNAEQLVPLASDFTEEDMAFVRKRLETSRPDERTLARMDYLDRAIMAMQNRHSSEIAEVVPMPIDFEAAAD